MIVRSVFRGLFTSVIHLEGAERRLTLHYRTSSVPSGRRSEVAAVGRPGGDRHMKAWMLVAAAALAMLLADAQSSTAVLAQAGDTKALNPQPIPPGKRKSSQSMRWQKAFNPQPIPPGKPRAQKKRKKKTA